MAKLPNTGVSFTQFMWDEKWKLFLSQYDLCRNHASKCSNGWQILVYLGLSITPHVWNSEQL